MFSILFTGMPSNKYLVEYSEQIMLKYGYTWEMMPLLYTILSLVHGNVDEAFKRIDEGSVYLYFLLVFDFVPSAYFFFIFLLNKLFAQKKLGNNTISEYSHMNNLSIFDGGVMRPGIRQGKYHNVSYGKCFLYN